MTRKALLLFCTLLLPLAGCAVHIPAPTPYTGLQAPLTTVEETQLLDVGIGQFTFKPPTLDDGKPDLQQADIRSAESRYMPVMLRHALTQAQAWGAVHVLPASGTSHDVRVEGAIVESSAHTLEARIRVLDATGALWFDRIYTEHVGDGVYSDNSVGVNDPFDGLYNRIANDMLAHVQNNLDAAEVARIREVAELKFGNEFAPELYGSYLATDDEGISTISRMPPANDPAVVQLNQIHQRDRAFQEVLQSHYVDFVREISNNYFEYRRQSFRELQALRAQQTEARNDVIGGALWLGVAVATSNIDDAFSVVASTGAAVVGAVKIVNGVRTYTSETPFLDELADSFANDVVTEVVALDEEVVTLSGSTEEIYGQWKEILRELFREDRRLQP